MTLDDDILIAPCPHPGDRHRIARLSVDDFDDPTEREITGAEIHLTVLTRDGRGEEPGPCFRLSVVSARELIRQLESAIRRRGPEGGGP